MEIEHYLGISGTLARWDWLETSMNSDNLVNTGKGVNSELKNSTVKTPSLFLYVVSVLNNEALGGSYFRFICFGAPYLR